jgi:hypothetical protein
MIFNCDNCSKVFYKIKAKSYSKLNFCSSVCYKNYRKQKSRTAVKCLACGRATLNPKFCSKSCSASRNNSVFPKRRKSQSGTKKIYTKCQKEYLKNRRHLSKLFCPDCFIKPDYKEKTLKELSENLSVKGKHPSWKFSLVRVQNRVMNKEKTKLPCRVCGYAKHVELAHIKSISSFPSSATIGEINSPENVVQLCPNCHWELDNGFLSLSS